MPTIQNFKIERHGERYLGSYKIEGGSVVVISHYGSRSAPLEGPATEIAEALLNEIVEACIARSRGTE